MKIISRALLAVLGLFVSVRSPATPIEEIAANPQSWPVEVTVVAAARAGVVRNGQVSGMMLVGAGKKLVVTGIAADGVTGKLGGATVRVPVDKTDLLQRLGTNTEAAPPAPPAEVAREVAPVEKPAPGGPPSAMQRRLSGKLVRLEGGSLRPAAAAQLEGVKYFALYYSASWCGPCRQFTPGFVAAYRKLKQEHPEFEVVFISADNSSGDMRDYMKDDRMPWPALKYDLREKNPELLRYSGPGIPCLVLVDAAGRVLSDSYDGDNYVGPDKVLKDTARLLARGR